MAAPKLRILHLADVARPIVNGVVVAIEQLALAQGRAGHEVFTLGPQSGCEMTSDSDRSGWLHLPSLPLPTASGYRLLDPRAFQQIVQAYEGRFDLIHLHSIFAARTLASHLARRPACPVVLTYHTRLGHYAHYGGLAAPLFRLALPRLVRSRLRGLTRVIAPSAAVAAELSAFGVRVPVDVAPSGVDVEALQASAVAALAADQPAVPRALYVGRLAQEKNLGMLLHAFAGVEPPAELWLVGGGPARRNLEQLAAALGLRNRVMFTGPLAAPEVGRHYQSATVFVCPSLSESQGLVFAEALAAGLPIVALEGPVQREMLAGSDALIVPPQPAALADALRTVFAQRCARHTAAARRLRCRLAQRFTADACAARIETVYHTALFLKTV